MGKKDNSWNLSTCIYDNGNYLKSIVDTSVFAYNETINATDSVSRNVTNTIPTNMTKYYINKYHSNDENLRYKIHF